MYEPKIPDAAFDPADVATVDPSQIRESVLTQLPGLAQLAHTGTNRLQVWVERGLPRRGRHPRIVRGCGRSSIRTIVHNDCPAGLGDNLSSNRVAGT